MEKFTFVSTNGDTKRQFIFMQNGEHHEYLNGHYVSRGLGCVMITERESTGETDWHEYDANDPRFIQIFAKHFQVDEFKLIPEAKEIKGVCRTTLSAVIPCPACHVPITVYYGAWKDGQDTIEHTCRNCNSTMTLGKPR